MWRADSIVDLSKCKRRCRYKSSSTSQVPTVSTEPIEWFPDRLSMSDYSLKGSLKFSMSVPGSWIDDPMLFDKSCALGRASMDATRRINELERNDGHRMVAQVSDYGLSHDDFRSLKVDNVVDFFTPEVRPNEISLADLVVPTW